MALEEAERPVAAGAEAVAVPEGALTAGSAASSAAAAVKHYPIAPGYSVNVRSGPGTNHGVVRILPVGASVPINCQMYGTTESGPYGTSRIWDNIANGQFVSDAFVHTGSDGFIAPRCD
ncbi:hypothetical protein [Streptomyces sp. DW26H14]|uniref:hypothetical protein n=1 Tax=Streptomyces sp. DW26H14 TaxID=3435395 RepID=UPI00403D7007